jgi:hypothetical protein
MTHDPTKTVRDEARERFEALVRARLREPFSWGTHDCCMWAADAVLAKTGRDPAAEFRGTYSDAMGAARLLESLGGIASVGAMVGEEIRPLQATWGDVGMLTGEGREMLAVSTGTLWLATSENGLSAHALGSAARAWKCRTQQ